KVSPRLGIAMLFKFIFLYIFLQNRSLEALRGGHPYLYMYFLNIFIIVTVHMLQFSSQYRGAWIFAITGDESPKLMYSAAIKAFVVELYVTDTFTVGIVFSLRSC